MLDERVDFVLVRAPAAVGPRGGSNALAGALQMTLLGDAPEDRTPDFGLFPADHAGIFAALNLPRGGMGGN